VFITIMQTDAVDPSRLRLCRWLYVGPRVSS